MTEYRQGAFTFGLDWQDICDVCGKPALGHSHASPGFEKIMAELKRVAAKPDPVGEYMTLNELIAYSGWSERWLRDRMKDPADPLPCAKPHGGKLTFRRSEFDRWIARKRPDSIMKVVSEVMTRLGRKG